MRTFEAIDADIRALNRPMHPGVASVTNPALLTSWRSEIATWRSQNPEGDARYMLLLEEREDTETALARIANRQRRAEASMRKARLPERLKRILVHPTRLPQFDAIDAWVASDAQWLVLSGDTGLGKSVGAGYALQRVMEGNDSVAWMTAGEFATVLGGFNGQGEAERIKHVGVLVIDDFGTEHFTSFVESVFFEVLAARHENVVRTILTTNLAPHLLSERLGSRLADRMRASMRLVKFTGKSMRGV